MLSKAFSFGTDTDFVQISGKTQGMTTTEFKALITERFEWEEMEYKGHIHISPCGKYILKLSSGNHQYSEKAFAEFCMSAQLTAARTSLPKTITIENLEDGIFIVMERLEPLSEDTPESQITDQLIIAYKGFSEDRSYEATLAERKKIVEEIKSQIPDLISALIATQEHVILQYIYSTPDERKFISPILDFWSCNFMLRQTNGEQKEIVMIDQFTRPLTVEMVQKNWCEAGVIAEILGIDLNKIVQGKDHPLIAPESFPPNLSALSR